MYICGRVLQKCNFNLCFCKEQPYNCHFAHVQISVRYMVIFDKLQSWKLHIMISIKNSFVSLCV